MNSLVFLFLENTFHLSSERTENPVIFVSRLSSASQRLDLAQQSKKNVLFKLFPKISIIQYSGIFMFALWNILLVSLLLYGTKDSCGVSTK